MWMTSWIALVTLGILQGAPSVAHAPAPAGALTLDFLAADREGKTPEDLAPAEVELKIDGKVRPLLSLEYVGAAQGTRALLLLLDEPTLFSMEPLVRDAVKQLLASLQPTDRITYVATRRKTAGVIRGPEAVTRAVESMTTGPGVLYTCLSDMLTNIERMVKTMPRGRTSTLAVLGRGHPEATPYGSEGDAAPCVPRRDAMRQVAETVAAAQINVLLFTVDETNRSWGFEILAGNIGGTARLLTWATPGALQQAVASNRAYYRVTFASDPKAPDRPQRVELKVKRKHIRVTTSPSINVRAGG